MYVPAPKVEDRQRHFTPVNYLNCETGVKLLVRAYIMPIMGGAEAQMM